MLESALLAIQHSWLYGLALVFFAAYPIVTSLMWITTAVLYRLRWEPREPAAADARREWPLVSVLVPAHDERAVIARSVAAMLRMDYPRFEVIVVDDGSSDGTLDALAPLRADPRLRLVRKEVNEGKAMALNDAIPLARGEILMCLDADAEPDAQMLRHIVPHFDAPRVAAVTGNPRVRNTETFLARLQAMEFSSIISLLRRAQRIWGRVVTVSGVVAALRRSAVVDVGGFSPEMPTEDIELTWKLQKRFYDVRYEPRAICWMTVPLSWRGLYRQRRRWARGLMQVLHKHADVMRHWRYRRLWPVFVESSLSILWAVCFVVLSAIWIASYALGLPPVGASPIPNLWGMTIATICLAQLFTGAWVDRRYDPDIVRFVPYAVWYPLVYWMFQSVTTVLSLSYLFRRPQREAVRWRTVREGAAS
ncbi:glycosyltransferase [Calidifontimicrobium sp. SYSU G02091]|uniref:glycosyltransferase n=1 Tax=Calidifontimicrobium sp. SYSU G02091 TaxID=2926421 RepID=UPI001F539E1D|nr:glycosyltransferase [Calidifontimicrobium sp. SYSU G02091]MCI1193104.1 glycosyltransferase [Calidifontimicrobium sp. SYSU G02091]